LGSGGERKAGWVNVDLLGDPVDVAWNLASPLPFAPESVDAVFHEHLLEHLPLQVGAALMQECYRVLKPGGILRVGVPRSVLCQGASVSEKYEFIDAEYAEAVPAATGSFPAVACICRWLGVSKSGFYEWRSRPESATARRRAELKLLVGDIFDDSDGTYGYRRIAAQLARRGVAAGEELVRRLMRDLGLVACQPRPWRSSTTQQGAAGPIPDLVNRDFTAEVPGEKMVGDITYIPTWEGWAFLATVIDCATRKVVGWAVDDNYRTPLITSAIEMAARNLDLPADAVFHSDRGGNYTSAEFAGVLERLGIRQSVGRTGSCFDNALAESFNAAVKVERVHRTVYPTRKKARDDIARYIEFRYNRTRLHSALGYRIPQEAHDEYLNRQLAA
jgi:transposase InsO family protein